MADVEKKDEGSVDDGESLEDISKEIKEEIKELRESKKKHDKQEKQVVKEKRVGEVLSFIPETAIVGEVITAKAEHDAKKLMNKLAWDCKAEYVLTNSDYNYYLSINDPTCISLSRTYTNWILSYDMHLDEFSYFKISKNENLNI